MREIERDDGFAGRLAGARLLAHAAPDPGDVRAWAARLRASASQRIRASHSRAVGNDSGRSAVGRARRLARRSARCLSGHGNGARARYGGPAPGNRGGSRRVSAGPAGVTPHRRVRDCAAADRRLRLVHRRAFALGARGGDDRRGAAGARLRCAGDVVECARARRDRRRLPVARRRRQRLVRALLLVRRGDRALRGAASPPRCMGCRCTSACGKRWH